MRVRPDAWLTAEDHLAFPSEHVARSADARTSLDAEPPAPQSPPSGAEVVPYAPGILADGRIARFELIRLANISSNQSNNREHQKRETRDGP